MKINTRIVFQMNDDGTFTELERDSYEYDGPVAQCFGGSSRTASTTTTDIDTTQVGIESVEGLGIAAAGDVDFNQTITQTDQGAVGASFEFAEELAEGAFDFAGDVARQAGETSQRAIDTSQAAIATVATGGQSDLQAISGRTIALVAAAFAAILIVPQIFRRA